MTSVDSDQYKPRHRRGTSASSFSPSTQYYRHSARNQPCRYSFASTPWVRSRYSTSIAMLIMGRPNLSAKARHASRRIMLPTSSSFTSSQSTPARGTPASAHRSTAASVCPRRIRTPPGRARKGTICPGRVKSCGVGACGDVAAASARAVRARSCAEIPVVVPMCTRIHNQCEE